MRVLVTGHRGYIGSVLTTVLRHARFEVVGLDRDLYEGCDFGRVRDSIPHFQFDLREVDSADLVSFDAVVHLAALPDEGRFNRDTELIREVNEEATIRLADCCKNANVRRFVYASSCQVYGRVGGDLCREDSPTNSVESAAASNLRCERALATLADDSFVPVVLRIPSVYGTSPRLRIDTVVNGFVASAVARGQVEITGDPSAHCPLVHVEDLARACAAVLTVPDEEAFHQTFNIMGGAESHRLIDIAEMVAESIPDCVVIPSPGPRNGCDCRVDGSKFARTFPDFSYRWTLPLGIRQLRSAFLGAGMTPGEYRSDRFRRAARLASLLDRGVLRPSRRKVEPTAA